MRRKLLLRYKTGDMKLIIGIVAITVIIAAYLFVSSGGR